MMNSKSFRGFTCALFVAVVLLATACGTLQIDTEPIVSETEVAGSAAEVSPDAMDEVTPVPVEASVEAANVEEEIEPPSKDSEITDLDETWNLFTDYRLGFSIRFPKEMVTFRGSCTWNEDEGSFRPELAPVPVQVFEDTDAVYIAAEYYYELTGERQDGGRSYYDECNPVTNSLELLQDPDAFKEPYWKLVVEDIHDDAELDSFIKERYGPGCSVGEQLPSVQDGVYDVKIQGDGKDLAESKCPLNYVTVVKYFPEGNKVVAWDRGQANYFPADTDYSVVHDQEMEDSFRFLIEGSMETGGDLLSYSNSEYGFTLHYPSTWAVAEVNEANFVGPGSRSVQLSQGTVTLAIGYRRAGEEVALGGSGAPAGDFEARGTTRMLGQDVERYVIVYEGKDKVVMYGEPGPGVIALGGLEFSARLSDFNPDYDSVELSQKIQDEADMILSSLAIIEATGASNSGADNDYRGWQPYTNEQLGYSLMVPDAAEVMSLDPSQRVTFIGPEVDGKPQFQFMVVHYDIDAAEANNFMQDLSEGHRAFLESMGKTAEGQVEEMVIAGEPAIKLSFPAINESDPRDDYFFVHDGKVFTFSISHFGGVENQALNNSFLQSITFEQS
jgi:hypothetical protein